MSNAPHVSVNFSLKTMILDQKILETVEEFWLKF